MAITGADVRAYIMSASGLGNLVGGRVYKTQVPDDVQLEREDGTVKPYIVVTFQTPFMSQQGRSVAGGEKKQPYVMSLMVTSFASDADAADAVNDQVLERLVGVRPSASAGEIQMVGGFSYSQSDAESRPTRYSSGAWFRVNVNL